MFTIFISADLFIKLKHPASRYRQCNSNLFLSILKFNNILVKINFSQFLILSGLATLTKQRTASIGRSTRFTWMDKIVQSPKQGCDCSSKWRISSPGAKSIKINNIFLRIIFYKIDFFLLKMVYELALIYLKQIFQIERVSYIVH